MKNKYSQQAQKVSTKTPFRSNYGELADAYSSAAREPGSVDALAGDFQGMADAYSTQGPANQTSKAVLGGFGAGLQGYANEQRRQKLSPIEEQTQALLKMDAMLKQQMYEEENQNQQVKQFFKQASVPIMELSKAAMSGDTTAINDIAKGIYSVYRSTFQDPNAGSFDHYHNGSIYYEDLETGEIKSRNIVQAMYQSGIDPVELFGQDAPMVEAGLSPGAKMNYENSMKSQQFQLENMGLQNQKLRSDIDLNRVKAKSNIISPEEYKANAETAKFNRNLIKDEIKPALKANEAVLGTLEALEEVLVKSPNIVGSDLKSRAYRSLAKSVGLDENLDYANMKGVEFEKMLRPILGAQIGEKEGERLLNKFPSIASNPNALKKFITEEKPRLFEEIVKGQQQINAFNQQSHANLYDNAIHQNLNSDIESYSNDRQSKKAGSEMVIMEAPDGSRRQVNAKDVKALEAKGARIVQ